MADIEKIKALLKDVGALAPAGFGIALHFRVTSPDFLFQTYPKDWIDIYSEKGYIMHDPIVRWGFTENGTRRWSEVDLADDMNILENSAAYGLRYGIAIAIEGDTTRSGGGLARGDREYTDAEIADVKNLVQQLHDLTATKDGMTAELRQTLHSLSVEMTHPPTTSG